MSSKSLNIGKPVAKLGCSGVAYPSLGLPECLGRIGAFAAPQLVEAGHQDHRAVVWHLL